MKTRIALIAAVAACLAVPLPAEEIVDDHEVVLTEDDLDALLGPLALHPDALIALILPATTVPADIVLAARFLRAGGSAEAIDEQPWDESVRALARYPELISWLDKELAWTIRVGEAFTADPAGVMTSIQRLRARASASGSLTSTHQQRVIVEQDVISIVPASRQIIYVPVYDPLVVYAPRRDFRHTTYLRFGFGRPVGAWLRYDCDWWSRTIWCHDWDRNRRHDWDRRRHLYRDRCPEIPGAHRWRPREHRSDDDHGRRSLRIGVVTAPRMDAAPPVRLRHGERALETPHQPRAASPVVRRMDVPREERTVRIPERVERTVRIPQRVERGVGEPGGRAHARGPLHERQPRTVHVPSVAGLAQPGVATPRAPVGVPAIVSHPKVDLARPATPPAPRFDRGRSGRESHER